MEPEKDSNKLQSLFELYPQFGEEVNYLLSRNGGSIEHVSIDVDDENILCILHIKAEPIHIGILYFSETSTIFVEFFSSNSTNSSYKLTLDDTINTNMEVKALESNIKSLEESINISDDWFKMQLEDVNLTEMKSQLAGLKRRDEVHLTMREVRQN